MTSYGVRGDAVGAIIGATPAEEYVFWNAQGSMGGDGDSGTRRMKIRFMHGLDAERNGCR